MFGPTTSPGSGGYSPKVYQPTAATPRMPSRPSSITKPTKSNSSKGRDLAKEAEEAKAKQAETKMQWIILQWGLKYSNWEEYYTK